MIISTSFENHASLLSTFSFSCFPFLISLSPFPFPIPHLSSFPLPHLPWIASYFVWLHLFSPFFSVSPLLPSLSYFYFIYYHSLFDLLLLSPVAFFFFYFYLLLLLLLLFFLLFFSLILLLSSLFFFLYSLVLDLVLPLFQDFDTSCFSGIYPTDEVTPAYLEALEAGRGKHRKSANTASSSSNGKYITRVQNHRKSLFWFFNFFWFF